MYIRIQTGTEKPAISQFPIRHYLDTLSCIIPSLPRLGLTNRLLVLVTNKPTNQPTN